MLGHTLVCLLLGFLFAPPPPGLAPPRAQATGELELTFIGNMAFKITDGETTLLTDFPYRSGAFGYMSYDLQDVGPVVDGVSLITHEHADHWDEALFENMDLRLVAHPDIARGIDAGRVVPWSERIVYRGIVIELIATEHTDAHVSYRVTWHGIRMYFIGDTESFAELLAQSDLDVAFLSPWMAERLVASGERLDAARIVIYHHRTGERRPVPDNAVQPLQGQTLRLSAR